MKIEYSRMQHLVSLSTLRCGEVFETFSDSCYEDGELFMVIDPQDYLKEGGMTEKSDCLVIHLKNGTLSVLDQTEQVIRRTDAQLSFIPIK